MTTRIVSSWFLNRKISFAKFPCLCWDLVQLLRLLVRPSRLPRSLSSPLPTSGRNVRGWFSLLRTASNDIARKDGFTCSKLLRKENSSI